MTGLRATVVTTIAFTESLLRAESCRKGLKSNMVVLKYVYKFFPFKRWSLISLSLNMGHIERLTSHKKDIVKGWCVISELGHKRYCCFLMLSWINHSRGESHHVVRTFK